MNKLVCFLNVRHLRKLVHSLIFHFTRKYHFVKREGGEFKDFMAALSASDRNKVIKVLMMHSVSAICFSDQ